jgi:hypothetical protein
VRDAVRNGETPEAARERIMGQAIAEISQEYQKGSEEERQRSIERTATSVAVGGLLSTTGVPILDLVFGRII